uniref:Monocarboxylate transporter 9-like n=1 Tax=Phallusia mammillata TaxID=59560 RepID=A0A6F9DSH2_9ASCI|nr:monocarboxylate transporter 9-like [Phallusia mammillata]
MAGHVAERELLPKEAELLNYRWVILVASFLLRVLIFGSLFSVGVLYVEWLGEFSASRGEAAWIGSIATGSTLLMGPVASALLERFSCRQTITCSGIAMATGLVISSFATGVPFLCVSFGIVTGCAGGIANLASVVAINQYFDKQRPLAMGIGSGGVGIGAFIFGLLQERFVRDYSWRGSLLLVGALQLHVVVCGLLIVHPNQLLHCDGIRSCRGKEFDRTQVDKRLSLDGDIDVIPCDKEIAVLMLDKSNTTNSDERKHRRRSTFQIIRAKMRLTDKTFSLIKDPIFIALFLSDFLSWLVQFVPYVHLPERANMLGIPDGAILLSIMGIMNAVGKIGFGTFCTLFNLPVFKVYVLAQVFFGLVTVLSPFCVSFWSLAVFAAFFGLLSGNYGLMMVIPSQQLGEERFALAYGIMLAGEGIGVFLGPPLVGWMSDASESYDSSFFVAGSVLLLSALILLIHPVVCFYKKRKGEKNSIRRAWT